MIDPQLWKKNVLDIAHRISDKEYQRQQWFVKMTESSDLHELFYQLIDDSIFEEFLTDLQVNLTSDQKKSGDRTEGIIRILY